MSVRGLRGSVCRVGVGLLVGLVIVTQARAEDCYRYISGTLTSPEVKDHCVQQLSVTPVFVRLTEDGYDLLVPSSTLDTSAPSYRRSAAAAQWMSVEANLSSTTSVVEAMISEGTWLLGIPIVEQLNYAVATWLNTSGATTAIADLASVEPFRSTACSHIPVCTSCEEYYCLPVMPAGMKCFCGGAGQSCCVIHRSIVPVEPPL